MKTAEEIWPGYEAVALTEDDRKVLKEASEILGDAGHVYLAGRLAGLSGRATLEEVEN